MLLEHAENLARDLMHHYGLHDWSFEFDRAKRRFGRCSHSRKLISLSKHLVALNDEHEVQDTILHEIAHALAGRGAGHGPEWRAMCREVGAKVERCYTESVETPKHNWEGTCPNCGHMVTRMRLKGTTKTMACSSCCDRYSNGKYDPAFMFMWERVQHTNSNYTPEFVEELPA